MTREFAREALMFGLPLAGFVLGVWWDARRRLRR